MTALHVAIDCRVIDPRYPGIGRATLETVRALINRGDTARLSLLYGPGEPGTALQALGERRGVDLVHVDTALRAPADQWRLPRLLGRLRPTVYHATYYALPVAAPGRVVVTIYDLIPRLFPQYWPGRLTRTIINSWTSLAARRAHGIIACSQATADDIARLLPGTARKVSVAPLGVLPPQATAPAPANDDTPYLLYVGSNKPHKNLPRLVRAFGRMSPETTARLVIAGAWDARYTEARHDAGRLGLEGRVVFEHSPSDARLRELFAGALGFVFPSIYEGFGLPVIEAMAAGLPVATTDRGSLREVAAGAALLFDPLDEEAIAAALRRLAGEPALRTQLAAVGVERAAQFPWATTAERTWQAYKKAARA